MLELPYPKHIEALGIPVFSFFLFPSIFGTLKSKLAYNSKIYHSASNLTISPTLYMRHNTPTKQILLK